MDSINGQFLTGERALFQAHDLHIQHTVFGDGESPLKESRRITLDNCQFAWKYPLWYAQDVTVRGSHWTDTARAGVWYSERVTVDGAIIAAPKNFRRCRDLRLTDVSLTNAAETLWQCERVTLDRVTAQGDYFAMNCRDMRIDGLKLNGNYGFDGAENVEIRNSVLLTKDAFWNSRNVTVYDSYIAGEYLGWNAENLTLVNCTVESLQGFCYIHNLVMKQCRLLNTTLAFEYSTVEVDALGRIDSVKNPAGGVIRAGEIGEYITDDPQVDAAQTRVILTGERSE